MKIINIVGARCGRYGDYSHTVGQLFGEWGIAKQRVASFEDLEAELGRFPTDT